MIETTTRGVVNPAAVLPRVNLVPEAVRERAKVNRAKLLGSVLLACAIVVTAGLWFLARSAVTSAQTRVDSATATNTALQTQVAKYSIVPQIQGQLSAAQSQLATAMASDIRFSYLLNDLSLTIPKNVAITQMQITMAGQAASGSASSSAPTTTLTGPLASGVGSITFQGTAVSINAVANWLDKALANSPAYANPFVTNVGAPSSGAQTSGPTTFSSSLILTPSAFSHRFDRGLE